ncbi:hypothetical protein DB30_05033 [Enhygromyxa salina]|uniref:PEGA domain-containing protein n=1 Tax=Enhygromyxa salina TaxID=215803 RepID=A0A0C1ZE75_9BACT|nr:hypothetical protein [Enhygromyxa salina]KIG15979.1 hypothetical protein DB30_05033 [Enhygromyxa salina]
MTSARVAAALAIFCVALGCEFQIPAATYIHQTALISVQAEVVELGPLNPARVGLPSDAPIAEPMPHDRFSFEAVVVDPDGNQLPASEIESIWFQCGVFGCEINGNLDGAPLPQYQRRCDEIEPDESIEQGPLSMDDRCRIGEGDGRFEFVVPELGPMMADNRVANYYGVIAWNGRSAEDCWDARVALDGLFDNCGFIIRSVKVGPSWWMLAYASEVLGIETQIPVWQIPFAVYGQAANRTPSPTVEVRIDGAIAGSYPDVASFSVAPGSTIALEVSYDEYEQFGQTYFRANLDAENQKFWFEPAVELLVAVPHTTNAIHSTADIDADLLVPLDFVVDELAKPGRSTIFLVHNDDRYGEGVVRLDFEVQP